MCQIIIIIYLSLPPAVTLPQSDTPFIPLSLLMCYLCHSLLFYLNLNKTKIMLTFSLACSSWQSWSGCSRTCGLGINNKKRTCGGKRKCEGPASITSSCNLQPCQSRDDCYDFLRHLTVYTMDIKVALGCFQ